MEIIGYIASVLIGVSLGLIGGGGSILTVPVLVYIFGVNPVPATAYSLFIVGSTSLAGSVTKYRMGLVDINTAVLFGLPTLVSVYLTRRLLVPAIPETVFTSGSVSITKPVFLMVVFAILMLIASVSMIRKQPPEEKAGSDTRPVNYLVILLQGALLGVITGLVGAGGGFLIIPALVFMSKLPMKQAVGTSLLIIAANSLIGFTGDLPHYHFDWFLLLSVTGLAILGIFIGNRLSHQIPGARLKTGFGWFVLVMGLYIIVKELFLK